MNARKIGLSLVFAVAILAAGWTISGGMIDSKETAERTPPAPAVREVKTTLIDNRARTPETAFLGVLESQDRLELYAEVSGRLLSTGKRFREGTAYGQGSALLRIDDQEARLNLVSQKSNFLSTLTGALADIRLDFPERYSVWEAYAADLDVNAPLAPLPSPASQKEKFFLSGRGILNQYYTIESQQARLDKYRISAPFSGVLSEALITEGTLVRSGQKLGTFIATSGFEVSGTVPVDVAKLVSRGDSVRFESEDGNTYSAVVSRVGDYIDPSTQSTRIFASIAGDALREGMYLTGTIESRSIPEVMAVDNSWFQGENTLFVVQDSTLKAHTVTLLHRGEHTSLVQGLPQGQTLLAEGLSKAYDGMSVKPVAP